MTICIYCKKNPDKSNFSNREHIIPQAFGLFEPINFILNERQNHVKHVCNTCNKQFGGSIDCWLAKDSYEGYILRNKYLKNVKSDNSRRVSVKVSDGEYKGINIHFSKNMAASPMAQIGLLNKKNQWEYFLPDEVSKIDKKNFKLSGKNCLLAFQMTDDETKSIFSTIGIKFSDSEPMSKPSSSDLLCKIDSRIDSMIKRAMSKIAFNYFAYFNYKNIVLKRTFDGIRNFILTGQGEHHFSINNEPILADEDKQYKRLGHIIVINKNKYGNILAHVSLYNELKYTVFLGESEGISKLNVGFGHFFDPSSKKIIPIKKSRIIIPKPKLIIPRKKIWLPN